MCEMCENNPSITARHLAEIPVIIEMIAVIATTGWASGGLSKFGYFERIYCEAGLPEGARYYNSYWDAQTRCVILVFEHPDFPRVHFGMSPMRIVPQFITETIYLFDEGWTHRKDSIIQGDDNSGLEE